MTDEGAPQTERSWLRLAPLGVFLLLAGLFMARLFAGDASRIPSALIDRPAPKFALPAVEGLGLDGLTDAKLREGHVSIVNVFASWCGPCHAEHEALMALAKNAELAAKGVTLYGLSYKDEAANTVKFLKSEGLPYSAVGWDILGRTAIDFGVYGVPETFLIRGDGTVAYKYVGPLTNESVKHTLLPEIDKAMTAR